MLLAISVAMAIGLMALAYCFKRPAMALAASGAWIVAATVAYITSAAAWDSYYGMFWFCILMIVVAAFEALYCKEKKQEPEENEREEWEEYASNLEERRERIDRVRNLSRVRPRRKNRETNYEKTGKP